MCVYEKIYSEFQNATPWAYPLPHAPTIGTFPPPSLPAGHSTVGTPLAQAVWGWEHGKIGSPGFKAVPGGSKDGGLWELARTTCPHPNDQRKSVAVWRQGQIVFHNC